MVVRLSPCYILIHQEALLDVIHVVAALLKDMGLIDSSGPSAASPTAKSHASKTSRRVSREKSVLIVPFNIVG